MKKIYFVRHGECEGNVGPIRSSEESPLTKKGQKQANIVAKRCAKLSIDIIICSTMVRTKQTVESILKKIKKPIKYSDLFVERRRPKEAYNILKDDPKGLEAEKSFFANFHLPGYRYSDEENFDDLKKRAAKALKLLEDRPEEHILVVTHGFFMRVVMAYALFGKKLTGDECTKFVHKLHMENTGISVFGYDKKQKFSPWWLWIWNDHAHLD